MTGCPIKVDIPAFIRALREGNPTEALTKIREANPLTAICGRLCSAPCETACVLTEEDSPISIRALERYAWENGNRRTPVIDLLSTNIRKEKVNNKKEDGRDVKMAVVGSGPAGLTASVELARLGVKVTVFEALHEPGGVLSYGIPEFRLPPKILESELDYIRSFGVEIRTSAVMGSALTLKEIWDMGYKAVLLTLGSGIPKFSYIPGKNLAGIYFADEFLMRINLMKATQYPGYGTSLCLGEKVVVIGKGYAALDCARSVVRLDKDVTLVHQGLEEEFGGRVEELEYAKQEGVKLEMLTKVTQIIPDASQSVQGVKCIRMDFADTGDADSKLPETVSDVPVTRGQWQIIPVAGSEFTIPADTVIMAVGHRPNTYIARWIKDLQINKNGTIWTAKNSSMTSIPGVFIGGDLESGPGPMIQAMGQAKRVAEEMRDYVMTHVFSNKTGRVES